MSDNHKYINFVKASATNTSNNAATTSGLEIKQFYEQVISQPTTATTTKQNEIVDVPKLTRSTRSTKSSISSSSGCSNNVKQDIKDAEKCYLKAAQENDLKSLKKCIESGVDINTLDDYKWSALMIAIASSNVDIVDYLLKNGINIDIQDKAGNNAIKLAFKINNRQIIDLLIDYTVKNESEEDEETIEISDDNGEQQQMVEYYCESCKKSYGENGHLNSISHLFNANKCKTNNIRCVNYHLNRKNKGYQLLLKHGWKESAGLGKHEQGRVQPVKAKEKYDRHGIGLNVEEKRCTRTTTTTSKYFLRTHYDTKRLGGFSQMKSLKDFKKDSEKEKKFERKFRRYYDS